jgi:uncharacterized repeat protein (TIGR02543 family)
MFDGCTAFKVSDTPTETYQYAWRIPTSGPGTAATNWNLYMLSGTGGTFTGNPTINTIYYVENPPVFGFSITFETNGGTAIPDIEEATELPDPLPTPTKSGYTFLGWYYDSAFTQIATAGDTIESDVTLYAKWQLNTYTITFNSNGGTTISDIEDATELPTPLPTPTKEGYTFVGWYYDIAFTQIATAGDTIESDVTLYAKWQLNTYTITFNSNGGTTIPDIEDATELPTPLPPTTKSGYTFGGWYYESNFQTRAKAGDTIEANTTLYAKWLTLAQVLEHINNVVEELRSAIIDKGGDAEGKLLIDFAAIINSLKTYEVVETLAELELLEPTLNRVVFVVEGSGELTMGAPVKVTQDGDTLIIG